MKNIVISDAGKEDMKIELPFGEDVTGKLTG